MNLGHINLDPVTIFGDNQGALALAKNPVFGGRLRHLRLKEHTVRKHVNNKDIKVVYIQTNEMVVRYLHQSSTQPTVRKTKV